MLRKLLTRQWPRLWRGAEANRRSYTLRITLWVLWTLMVAMVAYMSWHADLVADRPSNALGLVIHCAVAGVIGLVAMTWIEMRLEPWRFTNKD